MSVCTRRVRVHTHVRGAPGAEVGAGWPRSLALGPVCLQDQKQVPSVSPTPGVAAGLAGSFLMEGKEVWEGRKGSVSLATSDSLASPQIHLKRTGLGVKDLPQGHGELGW